MMMNITGTLFDAHKAKEKKEQELTFICFKMKF
jgi:hypothetical protein